MFCKKANEVGLNQIVALPAQNSRCKNWIKIYRIGPNENPGVKISRELIKCQENF